MEESAGERGFQQAGKRHRIKAVEAERRGWGREEEFAEKRSIPTSKGGAGRRSAGGDFRLVEMAYANAPRHSRNKLKSPGLSGMATEKEDT